MTVHAPWVHGLVAFAVFALPAVASAQLRARAGNSMQAAPRLPWRSPVAENTDVMHLAERLRLQSSRPSRSSCCPAHRARHDCHGAVSAPGHVRRGHLVDGGSA